MKRISLVCLLSLFSWLVAGQTFSYDEKKGFSDPNTFIYDARFSPFRNYFALTYGDNRVEVYDRSWRKIFEHQGNPKSNAGNLSFSPDEEYLAFSRYKSATDIAILRLSDLKIVAVFTDHSDYIMDMTFNHAGDYFVAADYDGSVCIWQINGNQYEFMHRLTDQTSAVRSISFSFDDRLLATSGDEKNIYLYEFDQGHIRKVKSFAGARGYTNKVLFHPTEMILLSRTSDFIYIWDQTGNQFTKRDSIDAYSVSGNGLAFSPLGDYLAAASSKVVRIYRTGRSAYNEMALLTRHSLAYEEGEVFQVGFSEDGQFLITASADKTAFIWEVAGVKASLRSTIAGYLNNGLTLAQKRVLTGNVLTQIQSKLDPMLTQPKDEFETTEQYNQRRQALANTTLSYIQDYIEKAYKVQPVSGGNVRMPIQGLVGYNADKQIYKIKFLETEAGVDIPVEPARSFKSSWEKAYVQAWKFKDPNTIAYDYSDFQLVHPTNGRTYPVTPLENPFHLKSAPETMKGTSDTMDEPVMVDQTGSGQKVTRALLFATDVYDSFSELTNPVLDANTMASELAMNYGTLVEVIENPTLDETIRKIREYARFVYDNGDQLLIFFAGHGVYDEVFKEGYVISRDSRSGDETKTTYLSHSNLRTIVNNIPCNHILLVMDVCFGGTFDPLMASSTRAGEMYEEISVEDFIERKSRYKTRLYLTSGGNEYVPDGRPGHHSPFMRKFLEALRSYGGRDGITTVSDILQYLERVDPQPRFGEFGDNEPGSDFLLILKN